MVVHSSSGCRQAKNELGPIFRKWSIEMALRDRAPSTSILPLLSPFLHLRTHLRFLLVLHTILTHCIYRFSLSLVLHFWFLPTVFFSTVSWVVARHLLTLRPLTRRGDRCGAFQLMVTSATLLPARQYPRSSRCVNIQWFKFGYLPVSYPNTEPSML